MRDANVYILGGVESRFPRGARSVQVKDRRGPAFLLTAARYLTGRCGEYDRQWILQASVSREADGGCRGGPEAPGGELGGECRITRVRTGRGFCEASKRFSMGSEIYFDDNATTRVLPEVFEAMRPYLTELYGNPSSIHRFGSQVAQAIGQAREHVAALIGASDPVEVIITS